MTDRSGFFHDDKGTPSALRVMSMVSLAVSIVFALITVLYSQTDQGENGLLITVSFLVAAFGPKAVQKFGETPSSGETAPAQVHPPLQEQPSGEEHTTELEPPSEEEQLPEKE